MSQISKLKKTKQKREIIHNFFSDGLITKKVSTAIKSFTWFWMGIFFSFFKGVSSFLSRIYFFLKLDTGYVTKQKFCFINIAIIYQGWINIWLCRIWLVIVDQRWINNFYWLWKDTDFFLNLQLMQIKTFMQMKHMSKTRKQDITKDMC